VDCAASENTSPLIIHYRREMPHQGENETLFLRILRYTKGAAEGMTIANAEARPGSRAMAETLEFAELLSRARHGDTSAAAELARQYESEVRIMARVLLGKALRRYLDSMDVVQSVHRSLLVGLRHKKYKIERPEHLLALALTMVRRKIARQWRRHRRQQQLPTGSADSTSLASTLAALVNPADDPARAAQVNDDLHRLCAQLDDQQRQIIHLRLLGWSTVEVARQLGLDADVLRANLSRLRQRLRARGLFEEAL
jgi:RNA polymerase sigma factor (sigma-70 family)